MTTTTRLDIPFSSGRAVPTVFHKSSNAPADAPLIIFGPGSGENLSRGPVTATTLTERYNNLVSYGHHKTLAANADKMGFHVLIPLFVQEWNNWVPAWTGGTYIENIIDWAVKNLPIDPTRIILMGYSEGGCMVLDALTRNERLTAKIAGGVVLSGGGVSNPTWKLIADFHIPVWFYHAKDDTSPAPYSMSVSNVESIRKTSADPAPVFHQIPSGGHNAGPTVGLTDLAMYNAALTWKAGSVPGTGNPEEPEEPAKTIVAKLEITLFSDGTTETKKLQ
jgi:predicted peptidase